MSSLLSAELAATCNALGYFDAETNKYYADKNTLETTKDLIRYLRRDDESHEIRRHLGETQVLQTDLLPLLKSYWEQTDLFDVLLRLLVNLTSPPLMLWQDDMPTEKTARNHYLQVEDHLQKYKQAFADGQVWAALSTKLSKILEIDFDERGEENSLIIERILILIRNVLFVPSNPEFEKRPDDDANIHDQVLWSLHQSGMLDIILFMASSSTEQAYFMHVLEIMSFMLREQSASDLANAALQRTETEKMRDEAELLAIKHRETNQKLQKIKMYNGARHSRFGGTFVMKSISNNELIYHKPLNKINNFTFDVDKKIPRVPKNRMDVRVTTSERRSAFSIRLFLKEFCIEFLNGAYNTFTYHVKDNLVRAKAQSHDESYYLWAVRFFMEFNRCYKFQLKFVSETMSNGTFHFVQQQMENYFDMIQCEKKKVWPWARRLHLALLAYRELLLTLCFMNKSSDKAVRDSAKIIQSNIFYVIEYRELVLTLLITYDKRKMSQIYLNDLIETQHIFLTMFETYCKKFGSVVVQKKTKAKRKKKSAPAVTVSVPEINLEAEWDEVAPQLSAVLEGITQPPSNVVPFDAASEVPIDEQKTEAMKNIQLHLKEGEFEMAIGLLRAAREVWPENDYFGSSMMAPEEELLALRDIYLANLCENAENIPPQPQQQDNAQEDYDNEEDEEMEGMMTFSETDFQFSDFSKRLANPRVVRVAAQALKNFEKNSIQTNHCIVKLLHRIAWDLEMYAMIFQASIFRTFQKIYAQKDLPQFKELAKFATYIMRQFFAIVPSNPKIFMETLFWKNASEAHDVKHGYGSYHEKSKASARAWTELEEDELRRLFMEHQEKQLTEDVVDWTVNNLIDNTRSRRGVLKKLKEMSLLTDYKGRKSGISRKVPIEWGEDEEEQLKELYEQFKDAMDPLECIMERMNVRRARNRIVEKLLVMGLIQDKKEVRKKRSKKNNQQSEIQDDDLLPTATSSSESSASPSRNQRNSTNGPNKNRASVKKRSNQKVIKSVPIAHLVSLLRKVSTMTEALEWLKESLTDVVDDLKSNSNNDDDNEDGIPLVAITDAATSAMENEDFLKLLKCFGINEPESEQEIYWRIPSLLSLSTLEQHIQLLTNALDNKLDDIPTTSAINREAQNGIDSDSSDEDVFDQVRRSTVKNASDAESDKSNTNQNTSSQARSKGRVISSDSKDESVSGSKVNRKNKSQFKKTSNTGSDNQSSASSSHKNGKKKSQFKKTSNTSSDSQSDTSASNSQKNGRKTSEFKKTGNTGSDSQSDTSASNSQANGKKEKTTINTDSDSKSNSSVSSSKAKTTAQFKRNSIQDVGDSDSVSSGFSSTDKSLSETSKTSSDSNNESETEVSRSENSSNKKTRRLNMIVDSDEEISQVLKKVVESDSVSSNHKEADTITEVNVSEISTYKNKRQRLTSDSDDQVVDVKRNKVLISDEEDI